ncbi:hypothetical protein DCS_04545 [Drechmeria coniospora]|uniref:Aminoglycoside phosphotransferase domain-containing protein n=1 Tax=Drechmeria coniospora TaxID=98403 RepID=A0A151GKA5_DRECN|nr:hypothetical protein DCS_04545 [Drechmeria coniospora]KYK57534.1 hypothetical protein DCS_04545 [Drechmeria coniospora]ODA79421.1 hypothetical protein RJ55_05014 [Drechmeria coniospora]
MPPKLNLVGRHPITIDSALEEEKNVINWASYGPATDKLYDHLWTQRRAIEALIQHHLALGKRDTCTVLPPQHWIRGSFNICILVEIYSALPSNKVLFRCPIPHKLAEARYPGTIDEKLGCEVGAYIWVQEHCPEIRSPDLFGFGFLDGRHFTHSKHMPFFSRLTRRFWRTVYKLLRLPLLSHYVWNPPSRQVGSAYMVLEYLGPETGRMLSDTFETYRDDEVRRQTLFKGISRIILSLARIPQARIGSFQFNNDSTVTLTNRPLSCSMMILENDGAPRTMQREDTYSCTDAFVSDTLTFHDDRFLSQPNAVYSEDDCRGQMAVKALLRVLSHDFIQRELRSGPFLLQLTDFHASNILVDKQWNVMGLIDLEWICALPPEMLEVPYWLTGCAIDQIKNEKLDRYDEVRQEFMRAFQEEERATKAKARHGIQLSKVMQGMWESKGVWFWHCLSSVNAMYFLLETHLYPPESLSLDAEMIVSSFWCRDPDDVVRKKMADKQAYDDEVRSLFCD